MPLSATLCFKRYGISLYWILKHNSMTESFKDMQDPEIKCAIIPNPVVEGRGVSQVVTVAHAWYRGSTAGRAGWYRWGLELLQLLSQSHALCGPCINTD